MRRSIHSRFPCRSVTVTVQPTNAMAGDYNAVMGNNGTTAGEFDRSFNNFVVCGSEKPEEVYSPGRGECYL